MSTIYVSPNGDDSSEGSAAAPLATIQAAVDRAGGVPGTRIELEDGVYLLSEPVRLGPQHRGLTLCATDGAAPVLDGGTRITAWSKGEINGIEAFVADVSGILKELGRPFRSLFVQGARRPRSRFPLTDYIYLKPSTEGSQKNPFAGTKEPELADPSVIPSDWSLAGAELRVLHKWVDERMPVESFDAETGRFRCAYRSIQRMTGQTEGWKRERAFLENVRAAVREPGQWYLDESAGTLSVIPQQGETLERFEAVVPQALQLLRIEGALTEAPAAAAGETSAAGAITVSGLTFRHTDWVHPVGDWGYRFDPYLPKEQWHRRDSFDHFIEHNKFPPDELYAAVPQAAHNTPGAVHLFAASDCTFSQCAFEHLGFFGIEMGDGCKRNVVDQCTFVDLGGGALNADGGNREDEPHRHLRENVFSRNEVHATGRVFLASVAVLIVFGSRNRVVANHIHDLRYTGISCGWTWDRGHQIARENLIAYNHIHSIRGQDLLSDLGGIYILGIQPGTVLRGNTIHDIHFDAYGGSGIYTDAATANVAVEDNLIYDIQGSGITVNHHNVENVYRRNVIAFVGDVPFAVMRNPARFWSEFGDVGRAGTIVSNIMVGSPVPYRYAVHPAEFEDTELIRVIHSEGNLILQADVDAAGQPPAVAIAGWEMQRVMSWDAWQAGGQDRTTIYVDPGFADPQDRDFTLPEGSVGRSVVAAALWHPCTAGQTPPPLAVGGTSTSRGEENPNAGIPDAGAAG